MQSIQRSLVSREEAMVAAQIEQVKLSSKKLLQGKLSKTKQRRKRMCSVSILRYLMNFQKLLQRRWSSSQTEAISKIVGSESQICKSGLLTMQKVYRRQERVRDLHMSSVKIHQKRHIQHEIKLKKRFLLKIQNFQIRPLPLSQY